MGTCGHGDSPKDTQPRDPPHPAQPSRSPLPLPGQAVVLDEQRLDVLGQQVVVLQPPVPQDAGGELIVGVARAAQHHLHHLLAGPAVGQQWGTAGGG